ncbi:PH (Pleckstrin Homology) domain-containing protein [Pseudonocardia sediminis]|uniref:PH (Pleckstrin Homology) domain-containing protein n=1 Tax=Pseudonocardia sediminis TaxID=1397368 RepID=A0A4Q7URG2_PSEST|nr:PH domain-containing protein [Pseudonocardia sediminis]RZT83281.1 PH (Pleckstrin Homology) domain-containing protein [Pseudonocardia sediminis]
MGDHDRAVSWSTPTGLVVMAWVLAGAAAVWLVLLLLTGSDRPGQLIAAVAAAGLGTAAASGTKARPRLAAGPDGLVVRRLSWTLDVGWGRVDNVRVLRQRRFGRESSLLELELREPDGAERLVILGRLELGEDPEEVAEVLETYRTPR